MATASEIIQQCGGYKAVAEQLGLDRTAVLRWTYPGKNGPGDQVPTRHWAAIMRIAKAKGVSISLDDLAPSDAVEENGTVGRAA